MTQRMRTAPIPPVGKYEDMDVVVGPDGMRELNRLEGEARAELGLPPTPIWSRPDWNYQQDVALVRPALAPQPEHHLPTDPKVRKDIPLARGLLDYFPDALCEVAHLSKVGNDQHNPGQPMHWAKEKSTDHADCVMRHLIDRGTRDTDGVRHSAKVAWRALALLQIEIENERKGVK